MGGSKFPHSVIVKVLQELNDSQIGTVAEGIINNTESCMYANDTFSLNNC